MPQGQLPKKVLVELRFAPTLKAYSALDATGIELSSEYPDWERSPLTLEIRNKKKHHRLFMSFERSFYEVDDVQDAVVDMNVAIKRLREYASRIGVDKCKRVGVRHWFAVDLGLAMPAIVDRVHSRFVANDQGIASALGAEVGDVGYVVDFETPEKHSYKVRFGPMELTQWLTHVPYEPDNFDRGKGDDLATHEKLIAGLPATFLYFDTDASRKDCPLAEVDAFCTGARRKVLDALQSVIELVRGGSGK